ncbi:hypothetical protein GCM10010404_06200 [Nonomuraea africana]|uniref:IS256 family transposase n=1 Tax=Nonomuraea africana TaxID=46171 RepID=A0ABR9KLG3_9ACTN|nr:hypothetical protein [Nonomuraea africana]MBE1562635.1 hypothetical protein [Nonomuraea africana]
MALDGELVTALEKAAEQEQGLHQRGKSRKTTNPAETGSGADGGGYGCGAGSG